MVDAAGAVDAAVVVDAVDALDAHRCHFAVVCWAVVWIFGGLAGDACWACSC